MLSACDSEHVALATYLDALASGDASRIDWARRKHLAAEQRVDETADAYWLAKRVAKLCSDQPGASPT